MLWERLWEPPVGITFEDTDRRVYEIYRAITEPPLKDSAILGPDYWAGASIAADFAESGAQYVAGSMNGAGDAAIDTSPPYERVGDDQARRRVPCRFGLGQKYFVG